MKAWYQRMCQEYIKKQKAEHEIILKQRIENQMEAIRQELSQVLQYCHYTKIEKVHSVYDIRPEGYRVRNKGVIYCYSLAKSEWDSLPNVVCESIRSNMNKDIAGYQQKLLAYSPPEEIEFLYPHLFYGIYIMKVENSLLNVRIYVASGLKP